MRAFGRRLNASVKGRLWVYFTLRLCAAEFTGLCQEALHDCTARSIHLLWTIVAVALRVSAEGDPTQPGEQRCLARSTLGLHLQPLPCRNAAWPGGVATGARYLCKIVCTLVRGVVASVCARDRGITLGSGHL
jgi:hypothetical protein